MEIKVIKVDDVLLVPAHMKAEPGIERAIEAARMALKSMPPVLLATPWIIGSYMTDIYGNPRSAESHSKGKAVDISPCYSAEEVLPPTGVTSGMAWNIADLTALASIKLQSFWCVEGDHIHISLLESPSAPDNAVWSFPSISPVYPMAELFKQSAAKDLLDQPYLWHCSTASLIGPNVSVPGLDVTVGDKFYASIPNPDSDNYAYGACDPSCLEGPVAEVSML